MEIGTQLLFFFSCLGVFNGFLVSMYFLFILKTKRAQNLFFGLLLLMLSIRIGKSVFHFFLDDLSKVILQIGLSTCFFIGPFLFFYTRSVLRQQTQILRKEVLHLLSLLVIILAIGLIYPYPKRPDLWNPEIVQGIYAVWLGYVVASGYLLRDLFPKLFLNTAQITIVQKWLLVVFGTNVLICLVFNSILYFGFPSYILGPITFSLVFYGLAAFLLFFPKSKTIIEGKKHRYANKKINAREASMLKTKLQQLMVEKHLFKNPALKLPQVANALQVSPHLLSQFLNDNLSRSFSDFVNEYRVEAACKLLETEHNLTIEGIGLEVGFRSKSSFYSAFKKQYGTTPNQFSKRMNGHYLGG